MNIKMLLSGGVLSMVAGGGIYGLYLSTYSKATIREVNGENALQQCIFYEALPAPQIHGKGIQAFIDATRKNLPSVRKGDAIATITAVVVGGKLRHPVGAGQPLSLCLIRLENKLHRLNHLR